MSQPAFEALGVCASAQEYAEIVENLFTETESGALE